MYEICPYVAQNSKTDISFPVLIREFGHSFIHVIYDHCQDLSCVLSILKYLHPPKSEEAHKQTLKVINDPQRLLIYHMNETGVWTRHVQSRFSYVKAFERIANDAEHRDPNNLKFIYFVISELLKYPENRFVSFGINGPQIDGMCDKEILSAYKNELFNKVLRLGNRITTPYFPTSIHESLYMIEEEEEE